VAASTSSDGTRNWSIPTGTTVGSDYKIKISQVTDSTIFDFSDANFSIGSFELTSPNGGENWELGSFQKLKFNTPLLDGEHVVDFELWKGGIFERSLFDTTDADGSKNWDIPMDITPGSDYRIKIFHHNDTTDFDFSDADFTISAASSISLTSPIGGEDWLVNTTQHITWIDDIPNQPENKIKFELWKGGVLDTVLFEAEDPDGSKIHNMFTI